MKFMLLIAAALSLGMVVSPLGMAIPPREQFRGRIEHHRIEPKAPARDRLEYRSPVGSRVRGPQATHRRRNR
jgi:hypothetical protein